MTTEDSATHRNTAKHNHAVESDAENMTAKIQFFCWPEEKSAWIRAAHPQKLSSWIRHQLNQATGRPDKPTDEERRRIVM
jgi:hypothetical protein